MPNSTGMALTIDLDRYLKLPPGVKARFDGWLDAETLTDKHIVLLRLAEGHVTVERYKTDDNGRVVLVRGQERAMTERTDDGT